MSHILDGYTPPLLQRPCSATRAEPLRSAWVPVLRRDPVIRDKPESDPKSSWYASASSSGARTTISAIVALRCAGRCRQWFCGRPRRRSGGGSCLLSGAAPRAGVARQAAPSGSAIASLNAFEPPTDAELREMFEEATGGQDTISLDEALDMEEIQVILDDEALTDQEVEVMWGEKDRLNFKDFQQWYMKVAQLYNDILWNDAVGLPQEALEDEEAQQNALLEFTDEELLEDMPAKEQELDLLARQQSEKKATEKKKAKEALAFQSKRNNVEITKLFKEQCDAQGLLSYEGLVKISDLKDMMDNEELADAELEEFWQVLPKVEVDEVDCINVLTFRDLLARVDDLFDYDDDDEDDKETDLTEADDEEKQVLKDPQEVKQQLLSLIADLRDTEDLPMGMAGREMTDEALVPLCVDLEAAWRNSLEDMANFDPDILLGDWEMIYTNSGNMRRWGSLLNTAGSIENATSDSIYQSFTISSDGLAQEYDLEEVLRTEEDDQEVEISYRGVGTWSSTLSENVISGGLDILLRMNMQAVEYETPSGEIKGSEEKPSDSQMLRTFNYSFVAFVDEDIRIMRPTLTGTTFFIFQKLADQELEK